MGRGQLAQQARRLPRVWLMERGAPRRRVPATRAARRKREPAAPTPSQGGRRMSTSDERHEEFGFATAEEAEAEERARWEASRDEVRARSQLYPPSGCVQAATV